MVDFSKLRDPAWIAESKAKRLADEALMEAKLANLKGALGLFAGHEAFDRLTQKEQDFINSCDKVLCFNYRDLSPKQEAWLFDLAARERAFRAEVAVGVIEPGIGAPSPAESTEEVDSLDEDAPRPRM